MSDRKIFHDSVVPVPVESGPLPNGLMVHPAGEQHRADRLTLHFSLAMPDGAQADLEARVARGETVSGADLATHYGAQDAAATALQDWLRGEGYAIEDVAADGSSVYASAPADVIASSLQVQMVRVSRNGFTYTAARNAPSLPAEVGAAVQAIGGTQPFVQASKSSRRRTPRDGNRAGLGVTPAATPTTEVDNAPPYTVAEILGAYGADGLTVDGSGQTIAILIDTFPADSDLEEFWKRNGLSVALSQVEKVHVGNGQLPVPEGEETLDAEWTSGIAPGATVRIYATGSLAFTDLDRALDRILADAAQRPGLRQLSISLGLGELYLNGPGGEVAVEHQKFLKLAALGVNVFVSSGDAGSNPDGTGHSATGPLQAEFEASDPYVIGVGGTTLELAADGSVARERGWSGSGGGRSVYFPRPAWQQGPGVGGTQRLVPDVGLTADPEQGGFVVLGGQVVQYGGTSWSAPIWAGFCALLNQARADAGMTPLPFLGPVLYPLAGSDCFRDVTAGSNGAYHATPGFDLVTGLGVPNVRALLAAVTA